MAKKAGISRKKADSDTKEYIAYRFYGEPDKGQAIQFSRTFGCARWMYNQLVAELRKSLEENTKAEFPSPAWYKTLMHVPIG
jgi:sarcosine oxidase delta subunit